jgi:hypothetical protein
LADIREERRRKTHVSAEHNALRHRSMRHAVKRSNHMRYARRRSKNMRHAVKRQVRVRKSISCIVQSREADSALERSWAACDGFVHQLNVLRSGEPGMSDIMKERKRMTIKYETENIKLSGAGEQPAF